MGTIRYDVREWEIEADSEEEIHKFLADAYKQDLPNVRGFKLRSIEDITPTQKESDQ